MELQFASRYILSDAGFREHVVLKTQATDSFKFACPGIILIKLFETNSSRKPNRNLFIKYHVSSAQILIWSLILYQTVSCLSAFQWNRDRKNLVYFSKSIACNINIACFFLVEFDKIAFYITNKDIWLAESWIKSFSSKKPDHLKFKSTDKPKIYFMSFV